MNGCRTDRSWERLCCFAIRVFGHERNTICCFGSSVPWPIAAVVVDGAVTGIVAGVLIGVATGIGVAWLLRGQT